VTPRRAASPAVATGRSSAASIIATARTTLALPVPRRLSSGMRCAEARSRMRSWMNCSDTATASASPCFRRIISSIMSSAAVPPAHVTTRPAIS